MRASPPVAALLRAAAGTALPGTVKVFTQRVADIALQLPCLVVTTGGGIVRDERFSIVHDLTVDAYAATPAAAEDLAWSARAVLVAARGHQLRDVSTSSAPVRVPEPGMPTGLFRATATYAVSLPAT